MPVRTGDALWRILWAVAYSAVAIWVFIALLFLVGFTQADHQTWGLTEFLMAFFASLMYSATGVVFFHAIVVVVGVLLGFVAVYFSRKGTLTPSRSLAVVAASLAIGGAAAQAGILVLGNHLAALTLSLSETSIVLASAIAGAALGYPFVRCSVRDPLDQSRPDA